MLSYFKKIVNWAKENTGDLTLAVGVILVALVSFGAGQLFSFSGNNQPIIIWEPVISPTDSSASIEQSLPKSDIKTTEQGMLVGSVNSNKYHWPNCPAAKKISRQNQIWFNSEKEAQTAGYARCANFNKYAPANYSSE
ncbi:MAG: hypothetical protein ABIF84_01315 [Patescibacteria group bacterium]